MGWTLFFMVVVLKIPMIGAGYLIWYSIKEQPDPHEQPDSSEGPRRPKLPLFPRWPRRGPIGGSGCQAMPCTQQATIRRPAPVIARSRQGREPTEPAPPAP
jgi:hypothetical protein